MSIKVEDYYARDTFQKMKAFADTQETPFVVAGNGHRACVPG